MANLDQQKHLFSISSTDSVLFEDHNIRVMNELSQHLKNINQINITAYRAGNAIIELVINYEHDKTFLLTIWEGKLNIPSLSPDDIRLAHKEISLPDVTDIMVFITRLSRQAQLSPHLSSDTDSAEIFVFS